MTFLDRAEAGRLLGEELKARRWHRVVVFAIPRGGVAVGAEVAAVLDAPLDMVVPRKVRAPHNPELGLGAVAPGVTYLDRGLIESLHVPESYLNREIEVEQAEVERRTNLYRGGRAAVELEGRTAIVVDDGIATGGTAIAALRWAREQGAALVVLAVPVAPPSARLRMRPYADEMVALMEPDPFYAVGQFYDDFEQVSDEEVVLLMEQTVPS